MSEPDNKLIPVGLHECVTCTKCGCTFAAVHPACPRCSKREPLKADYRVYDAWDNGEFLTGCKLDLILDGQVVETTEFTGSTEDPGGEVATRQAISYAQAWVESQIYTLEERIGPFGLEWEREQEERYT